MEWYIYKYTGGSAIKTYVWNSFLIAGTWTLVAVTWDGTNLKLYKNGILTAEDTQTTDSSGTMQDSSRRVNIGVRDQGDANFWDGRLHSTALWDTVLDSDANTSLYNSGDQFDWRQNSGNYAVAVNLQHYWRHGFNASDIGEDLGSASTLIDVGNNSANITAADIVDDYPGA